MITSYENDVFVSYSSNDSDWVWGALIPRIKNEGLKIITDRDFDIGVPIILNIEHAIHKSKCTLLVLTPSWLRSTWTEFESLLAGNLATVIKRQQLLPILKSPLSEFETDLPPRLSMLTYADFTNPYDYDRQFSRLLLRIKAND
ncbi:MAG: toll/interleukin-1 receptor domain-containing protein [bacterium]